VVYSGDLELLSSDILALRCGRCLFWRRMNGEVAAGELFFVYRSNVSHGMEALLALQSSKRRSAVCWSHWLLH
jgi:hypothetical protein